MRLQQGAQNGSHLNLIHIHLWYEIDGMNVNPSKHLGMILGKTDHQFNFSVNDSMELFGVKIDKDLKFK